MLQLDPSKLEEREQYKLMTGCIVPRPIALVTTLGPLGPNAAPFSLFNMIGSDPPLLMFSVGNQGDGSAKGTLQNLDHCPEFVVHICDEAIAESMNICATDYPHGINEIDMAGFTAIPSTRVAPPRIGEAPVHMECRLERVIKFGSRHNVIFGEVLMFHFRDGIVNERLHVNFAKLNPIARLSGSLYGRISETFTLERKFLGEVPKQLT